MTTITNIAVSRIHPCPDNPRKKIDQEELKELAQSISSIGMLQPITVRQDSKGYEIVCGHRRFEASKIAGLEEVPCIIRTLTDEEAYEIMVTENLQRKDVDPFEESQAFHLLKNRGYDIPALAEKFGKSAAYVYSRMKLQNLIPEFRTMYDNRDLDVSHCYILSKLDGTFQKKMLSSYDKNNYDSLNGKGVKELKNAIARKGQSLLRAKFDTSVCKNCTKNTGCDSLFLDMTEATCEDVVCFEKMTKNAVLEEFELARSVNPDFYILSEKTNVSDLDKTIISELKERGFSFVEEDYWSHETFSIDEQRKADFIDVSKPSAYSFRFNEYVGNKRVKSSTASGIREYKDDWRLDRMADDYEAEQEDARRELIYEMIGNYTDSQLSTIEMSAHLIFRNALYYIVKDGDYTIEPYGISSEMEDDALMNRILAIKEQDVLKALAAFTAIGVINSDYSTRIAESLFPYPFQAIKDRDIKKKLITKLRVSWHMNNTPTDEQVWEDFIGRVEKCKKGEK